MRDEDDNEIIEPGEYDLGNGQKLHVWISSSDYVDPTLWACAAPDHVRGFCRLCREVDGITNACLIAVIDGMMRVTQDETGEFLFAVTKAGEDQTRHLLEELDSGEGEGE